MPRFPTDLARRHLETLAAKHEVHLVWIAGGPFRAEAFPEPRIAAVPIPSDGTRYLVALHELGHVVDRRSRYWYDKWESGGDDYDDCVCESFAWAWASKTADRSLPISKADWARAGVLLSTYWATPEAGLPEAAEPPAAE